MSVSFIGGLHLSRLSALPSTLSRHSHQLQRCRAVSLHRHNRAQGYRTVAPKQEPSSYVCSWLASWESQAWSYATAAVGHLRAWTQVAAIYEGWRQNLCSPFAMLTAPPFKITTIPREILPGLDLRCLQLLIWEAALRGYDSL